ncbi:MAG TPA: hypothetical protein VGS80_19800, partial [Ktedonobacterales bacterium]|nr:hypothetical protein [Ktedonobacterales bacterium]
TFTTGPGELLERLRAKCKVALQRALARVDDRERAWLAASGEATRAAQLQPRTGVVLSYEELHEDAVHHIGEQRVAAELDEEWERWPANLDKRERSLHLVHRLWRLSGRSGPAVVISYSPPFYPSIAVTASPLHDAVADVIAAHPDLHLSTQEFFPYLSDMSYLRLDPGVDIAALMANMPVWRDPDGSTRPGAYSLPLEAIRELDMPVVDLGPYGRGAHQRGERVQMSRSFELLPLLIFETIVRLAKHVAPDAG